MWRFDVADLTDDDILYLRMLVGAKEVVGHIVVKKADLPWLIPIRTDARQWQEGTVRAAIN